RELPEDAVVSLVTSAYGAEVAEAFQREQLVGFDNVVTLGASRPVSGRDVYVGYGNTDLVPGVDLFGRDPHQPGAVRFSVGDPTLPGRTLRAHTEAIDRAVRESGATAYVILTDDAGRSTVAAVVNRDGTVERPPAGADYRDYTAAHERPVTEAVDPHTGRSRT